ncbi:MAG TPA: methyltransferase domain-containing protein [Candidatus Binataceae bacterium]|nr:methyltransferase domain-containing protein [Candidatus Binataceae bacterium]
MRSPRPRQFSREYADIFKDQSVVDAYRFRPAYPAAVFEILKEMIDPAVAPLAVLDAGCGTGFLARELTAFADQVDAVDISENMIRAGKELPGGDSPKLNWICGAIEEVALNPPYALIAVGEALHWMEWEIALPRFAESLAPRGFLAIVEHVAIRDDWMREAFRAAAAYSMNHDFEPYYMTTIVEELRTRGLFELVGTRHTDVVDIEQPILDLVESLHARNGFSRDRMSKSAQAECDQALASALRGAFPGGLVKQRIYSRVFWGTPRAV